MELEFTTTACNRAEILEKTYQSFTDNLKGVNYKKSTLYINIASFPDNKNITDVEKVARKYFGKVVTRYAPSSNLAKGIIWCFAQVQKDIFFHLDDHWVLNHEVDLEKVLFFCKKHLNWHQCIFQKNIKVRHPSLLPSLHNTKYTKLFLPFMSSKFDPGAQMKYIHQTDQITGLGYIAWGNHLVTNVGKKISRKNKKKKRPSLFRWTMQMIDSLDSKK